MTADVDLTRHAARKTIRLTTIGRRSGKPRTVTIWFAVDGPRRLLVQHVAKKPAQWHRNLSANPRVQVDFGEGPREGRAEVIDDREEIAAVLAKIGRKYWTYRLIRLFGGGVDQAVAARIDLV